MNLEAKMSVNLFKSKPKRLTGIKASKHLQSSWWPKLKKTTTFFMGFDTIEMKLPIRILNHSLDKKRFF